MFRRFVRSIRQLLTAVFLLLLAAAGIELTLQVKSPPSSNVVAVTASAKSQAFLNPSGTVHHELMRLSEVEFASGVRFRTNSFGLRGPEPVRNPNELRILLLGDETILGPAVEDGDTIAERLELFLSRSTGRSVEVINGGVPGYCPLLSWLQYRHQLVQLRPHIVVLHCDMSDVADDAAYRSRLRVSGQQPLCINGSLAPGEKQTPPIQQLLHKSAIVGYVQRNLGLCAKPQTVAPESLMDRYQWAAGQDADLRLRIQHALSPIERLAQDSRRAGAKFMVSCSPLPWHISVKQDFPQLSLSIDAKNGWPAADQLPFKILAAACEQTDISFCNTQPGFSEFPQPQKLYVPGSTMLSRWGATLYAREIASMLLKTQEYASLFSGGHVLSANRQTHY